MRERASPACDEESKYLSHLLNQLLLKVISFYEDEEFDPLLYSRHNDTLTMKIESVIFLSHQVKNILVIIDSLVEVPFAEDHEKNISHEEH
jgi:hypothetical protein